MGNVYECHSADHGKLIHCLRRTAHTQDAMRCNALHWHPGRGAVTVNRIECSHHGPPVPIRSHWIGWVAPGKHNDGGVTLTLMDHAGPKIE
jgi:hypothetical protein